VPVPGDQGHARVPGGAAHHLPRLGAQAPPPVLLPRQPVGGAVQHLHPQRCPRGLLNLTTLELPILALDVET